LPNLRQWFQPNPPTSLKRKFHWLLPMREEVGIYISRNADDIHENAARTSCRPK